MKPSTVSELREGAQAAADAAPDVEWRVSHTSLASALVAALEDLTIVKTGRTVKVKTKGDGPDYSYDYADLGDVVKLTRPALARHGLVALTPVHDHGQGLACTVTILHDGGERLDFGPFPFPHGRDAQATGSMVTYHRRYALVAALGMAAGDDDDGAKATARPAAAKPEPHPMRAEVAALDVGADLWADFLARAGIGDDYADDLLRDDDGWRHWLTGAIKAHQPAADGETT